jgi:hypothetical protein
MMANRQAFDMWAPPASPWSDWAKPTLFLSTRFLIPRRLPGPLPDLPWLGSAGRDFAAVVDLPAADSVMVGFSLARAGFRPVPLFNGCDGPSPAVDVDPIIDALVAGLSMQEMTRIPYDAPPAFLIDSRRQHASPLLGPGNFDNRWVCLPQDFPSGAMLKGRGIREVVLIRADAAGPGDDLLHILHRWQLAGLQIYRAGMGPDSGMIPMTVRRPRWFGAFFWSLLARLHLRPNAAGGFGSRIPHPSQG